MSDPGVCDSCTADGPVVFSPAHRANFCPVCLAREQYRPMSVTLRRERYDAALDITRDYPDMCNTPSDRLRGMLLDRVFAQVVIDEHELWTEIARLLAVVARVDALGDRWDESHGAQSVWHRVYGVNRLPVSAFVAEIRAAVRGDDDPPCAVR